MTDTGPGVRVPPPLIYLAGFVVGLVLEAVVTLPSLEAPADIFAGIALLLVGGALVLPSAIAFIRAGTNLEPYKPSTALVLTGPYRFTRNPIYIGFTLIYAGAALWSGVEWALILLPAVLVVMDRAVIVREERYLEQVFGGEYLAYKGRVRRWL